MSILAIKCSLSSQCNERRGSEFSANDKQELHGHLVRRTLYDMRASKCWTEGHRHTETDRRTAITTNTLRELRKKSPSELKTFCFDGFALMRCCALLLLLLSLNLLTAAAADAVTAAAAAAAAAATCSRAALRVCRVYKC